MTMVKNMLRGHSVLFAILFAMLCAACAQEDAEAGDDTGDTDIDSDTDTDADTDTDTDTDTNTENWMEPFSYELPPPSNCHSQDYVDGRIQGDSRDRLPIATAGPSRAGPDGDNRGPGRRRSPIQDPGRRPSS